MSYRCPRNWFNDLTPIQMNVFARIYYAWRFEGCNITLQEIADFLGTGRATADQHVRRLRAKGYVVQDVKGSSGIVVSSAVRNYLEVNKDGMHRLISA